MLKKLKRLLINNDNNRRNKLSNNGRHNDRVLEHRFIWNRRSFLEHGYCRSQERLEKPQNPKDVLDAGFHCSGNNSGHDAPWIHSIP